MPFGCIGCIPTGLSRAMGDRFPATGVALFRRAAPMTGGASAPTWPPFSTRTSPTAESRMLADAFCGLSVPAHRNEHIAAAALRADRVRVRETGRWLVRRASDRCAVLVGLALLGSGQSDDDVPLIFRCSTATTGAARPARGSTGSTSNGSSRDRPPACGSRRPCRPLPLSAARMPSAREPIQRAPTE